MENFDTSNKTIDDAKALLAVANDESKAMADRIVARDQAQAIRIALSVGKGRIGTWPKLDGDDSKPATTGTTASAAPKSGKPAKAAKSTTPPAPLKPGFVYVANAMQKFLFETVLIPNIRDEGGHWKNSKPEGHAAPFLIATCVIDPKMIGITFGADAKKRNYNLNDSTHFGQPEILNPIKAAASKLFGREVTKKELTTDLEALKKLFSIDVPVHEVESDDDTSTEDSIESTTDAGDVSTIAPELSADQVPVNQVSQEPTETVAA